MKKLYTLLILAVPATAFLWAAQPSFTLVGKWRGTSSGKKIEMDFFADGKARVKPTGEPELVSDSTAEVTYTYDDSHKPAWLDITVRTKPGVRKSEAFSFPPEMKILGIMKVENPDEILLAQEPDFVNPVRPQNFNDTMKVCRLRRIKP